MLIPRPEGRGNGNHYRSYETLHCVPDKMAKDSNRPVYFLVTKAWGKPSATQKCFRLWDGGNDEFLVHGTAFCDTVAQVAQVVDIMIKTLPYFTRDLGLRLSKHMGIEV